jgi:hypothetical protein
VFFLLSVLVCFSILSSLSQTIDLTRIHFRVRIRITQVRAKPGSTLDYTSYVHGVHLNLSLRYVESPLFFWQSKFDHFQLSAFKGISCMCEQAYNPPWVNNLSCSAIDTQATVDFGKLFMQQFAPVMAAPGPHRAAYVNTLSCPPPPQPHTHTHTYTHTYSHMY